MEQEMKRKRSSGEDQEEKKRMYDCSVDFKGRVPLRASTGGWKAYLFIIGNLALCGLWLINYLKPYII